MLSCSVVSDSLRPHGLRPSRFLCPWSFPGKNNGVGFCFLLQGIFPTQRLLYSSINFFKKKLKSLWKIDLANRGSTGPLPEEAEKEHGASRGHGGPRGAHGCECGCRWWARGPDRSAGDGKETQRSEMGMKAYGRRELKMSVMKTGTWKWECREFYPRAYLWGKISIGCCVRNLSFN